MSRKVYSWKASSMIVVLKDTQNNPHDTLSHSLKILRTSWELHRAQSVVGLDNHELIWADVNILCEVKTWCNLFISPRCEQLSYHNGVGAAIAVHSSCCLEEQVCTGCISIINIRNKGLGCITCVRAAAKVPPPLKPPLPCPGPPALPRDMAATAFSQKQPKNLTNPSSTDQPTNTKPQSQSHTPNHQLFPLPVPQLWIQL